MTKDELITDLKLIREFATMRTAAFERLHPYDGQLPYPTCEAHVTPFIEERTRVWRDTWVIGALDALIGDVEANIHGERRHGALGRRTKEMENPVIMQIPKGAFVTVHTAHGLQFSGADDTTREEESAGLFALCIDSAQPGCRFSERHVMRACDVVAFMTRCTSVG